MKKNNNKGFTLAELLIVVAIIAVLVAIAIPIFTTQLEKAREATDLSNIRAMYAEVMVAALGEDGTDAEASVTVYEIKGTGTEGAFVYTGTYVMKQRVDDWQSSNVGEVGGVDVSGMAPGAGATCTVTYTESTGQLAIAFN